jgi:hypothetical protein
VRVDELEMLRIVRDAYERAVAKVHAQQLGEVFVGLDDRRHSTAMRGADRRMS